MVKALELLREMDKVKSQREIGDDLGVSKATVNRLLKETYPNPQKMYKKILDIYDDGSEIIGISVGSIQELEDVAKLLQEI